MFKNVTLHFLHFSFLTALTLPVFVFFKLVLAGSCQPSISTEISTQSPMGWLVMHRRKGVKWHEAETFGSFQWTRDLVELQFAERSTTEQKNDLCSSCLSSFTQWLVKKQKNKNPHNPPSFYQSQLCDHLIRAFVYNLMFCVCVSACVRWSGGVDGGVEKKKLVCVFVRECFWIDPTESHLW